MMKICEIQWLGNGTLSVHYLWYGDCFGINVANIGLTPTILAMAQQTKAVA